MAAVSVLSLVNLVLMYVVSDHSLDTVLLVMNVLLTAILFVDFVYRLATAPSRSGYFFRLSAGPTCSRACPSRSEGLPVFRLVRVVQLMRGRGGPQIGRAPLRNRAGSALFSLLLMGVRSRVRQPGMLAMEQSAPGANITTASDSIWYVVVTISTVGYGDQYPVTNEGRIWGRGSSWSASASSARSRATWPTSSLAPKRPLRHPGEAQATEATETDEVADDTRERVENLRALLAQQQEAIESSTPS